MGFLDKCKEIGQNGGTVNTNGMTSTQKQAVDAAVNSGKSVKSGR